jgi:hypothetical protein
VDRCLYRVGPQEGLTLLAALVVAGAPAWRIAQLLERGGARVNARSRTLGTTALSHQGIIAASARLLLARPDVDVNLLDEDGYSALANHCTDEVWDDEDGERQADAVVALLLERPDIGASLYAKPVAVQARTGRLFGRASPLVHAAMHGRAGAARLILAVRGLDLRAARVDEALVAAMRLVYTHNFADAAKGRKVSREISGLLLATGAVDPHFEAAAEDYFAGTLGKEGLLNVALRCHRAVAAETVRTLRALRPTIDPNRRGPDGRTPLLLLAESHGADADTVRALLSTGPADGAGVGVDFAVTDEHGRSALHIACDAGNSSVVGALLAAPAYAPPDCRPVLAARWSDAIFERFDPNEHAAALSAVEELAEPLRPDGAGSSSLKLLDVLRGDARFLMQGDGAKAKVSLRRRRGGGGEAASLSAGASAPAPAAGPALADVNARDKFGRTALIAACIGIARGYDSPAARRPPPPNSYRACAYELLKNPAVEVCEISGNSLALRVLARRPDDGAACALARAIAERSGGPSIGLDVILTRERERLAATVAAIAANEREASGSKSRGVSARKQAFMQGQLSARAAGLEELRASCEARVRAAEEQLRTHGPHGVAALLPWRPAPGAPEEGDEAAVNFVFVDARLKAPPGLM